MMLERAGDLEPALHPAREPLHVVAAAVPEIDQAQQGFGPQAAFGARHAIKNAMQLHIFRRRQLIIKAGVLEDDAKGAARLERLLDGVVIGNQEPALARRKHGGQHLDGRGLAGAVGAKKSDDLPLLDRERNAVDGHKIAEPFLYIFDFNGVRHGALPHRWAGRPAGAGRRTTGPPVRPQ
jgi:hypothetical protein